METIHSTTFLPLSTHLSILPFLSPHHPTSFHPSIPLTTPFIHLSTPSIQPPIIPSIHPSFIQLSKLSYTSSPILSHPYPPSPPPSSHPFHRSTPIPLPSILQSFFPLHYFVILRFFYTFFINFHTPLLPHLIIGLFYHLLALVPNLTSYHFHPR